MKVVLTILMFCCAMPVAAQFRITLNLRQPMPAEIATWRDDRSVVTLQLQSLDADYDLVYIGIDVIHQSRSGVYARSRIDPSMRSVTNVRRSIPITLSGQEIIETRNIDYPQGMRDTLARTGVLPEGTYLFCVRLYDRQFREITGTGNNNCQLFTIAFPPQLMLRLPLAEASIRRDIPTVFSWSPVILPAAFIQYRLVIAPVFADQVPLAVIRAAFDRVTPPLVDVVIPATEYMVNPLSLPTLQQLLDRSAPRVTGFVWQVQALNDRGRPIVMRNASDGKSDYRLFTFERPTQQTCSGPMSVAPYWPADGDTLPWIAPHLIVQWGPFCNAMESFTYNLEASDNAGRSATVRRTLRWADDVIRSQGLNASSPGSAERARLIVTNWRDDSNTPPTLNTMFVRGSTIRWRITAGTLDRTGPGGTQEVSTVQRAVSVGLRLPQSPSPAHDARVDATTLERLSFTIPSPTSLVFAPADLHTLRNTEMRMDFGAAQEKARIRLSRSPDLSSPILDATQWLGREGGYVTGDADAESLFGSKSVQLPRRLAPGTYYWQVEYLDWQNGDRVYRNGPVWRFTIESDIPSASDCARIFATSPENRATIGLTGDIRFSVSTNPRLRLDAIRGGRLRVWQMNSSAEDPSDVRLRAPIVERSFRGNDTRDIVISPGLGTSATRSYFHLPFMNGALRPEANRSYLWEVSFDVDGARIREDGTSCPLQVITGSDNIFTVRDDRQCSDPCVIGPATVIAETPSQRAYRIGDEVTIGHFRARFVAVSGSAANGLSGEAEVAVPLFNCKVLVEFSDLRVNTEDRVYRGSMTAKVASQAGIPSAVANRLEGAFGLSRTQLESMYQAASEAGRLVSVLAGAPMTMPIGFDRTIEGQRIVIGVMGCVFNPRDAKVNVGINVPLPWLGPGERLGLGVRNVCLQPNGFGSDIDIALLEDLGTTPDDRSWSFHFLSARQANTSTGQRADDGTYVRFSCRGFEEFRVKAEARFPRTWMIPVDNNESDMPGLVTATLAARLKKTTDFFLEGTMDRFRPADAPDFVMQVDSLALDLSSSVNPESMSFPAGYTGDMSRAWKGFYINRIALRLPDAVRTFDSTRPVRATVRPLLIDRSGFSMAATVDNVVQYPRANFGDWGASLDTLHVAFASSRFQNGHMVGRLKVPISDSVMDYRASLLVARTAGAPQGIGFQFSVRPRADINAPLWNDARLRLDRTSSIVLEKPPGEPFRAIAVFSGELTITGNTRPTGSGTQGIQALDIRGVRFDSLKIQTHRQPYVSFQNIRLASPQHRAAGFDVQFTGWSVRSADRTIDGQTMPSVGLRLGARFILQRSTDGIAGSTDLTFWGGLRRTTGRPPDFIFGGVSLDEISLSADLKAVRIDGSIAMYDADPVFGNGFRGAVRATFIRKFIVDGAVQFGSIPGPTGYNYWFVDAKVILPAGIPVFSGVGLYGFGGGAWYNMRRETPGNARGNPSLTAEDRSALQGTGTSRVDMRSGSTPSGFRYVPERSGGNDVFGLYAMVTMATHPKPEAFNCDVRLTAEFSVGPSPRILSVQLDGQGYMAAGLADRSNAPITMDALLRIDAERETFYGRFGIDMGFPKARPILTATGTLVMYADPTTWSIKLGEPAFDRRFDISLMEPINRNTTLVSLKSYLMAGRNLDATRLRPPSFPSDIWDSLRVATAPPAFQADRGDGLAFGSALSINPPELQFLMFYASFQMELGFDMSLLNIGRQSCGNISSVGLNGWYARGTMYGFLAGAVGLQADLGFWQGRLAIFSARLGAMLEAGAPNPMWLNGAVRGSYDVLGGLLRGNVDFRFSVGDRCVPARNVPVPVNMLTSIYPADGATNIYPTVTPVATSNYRLNEPFDLEEMHDGNRIIHTYRIVPSGMTLSPVSDLSRTISGAVTVRRDDPTQMMLSPTAPLQWQEEYVATASAKAEKASIGGLRSAGFTRATWSTAQNARTLKPIFETIRSQFVTSAPPDTLVPEQVWNTYPRARQRFFLADECRDGFVLVAGSYEHLFPRQDLKFRYEYLARFVELNGTRAGESTASYSRTTAPTYRNAPPQPVGSGGRIAFSIPPLRQSTTYAVQIVRRRLPLNQPQGKQGTMAQLATLVREGRMTDAARREFEQSFSSSLQAMRETQRAVGEVTTLAGEEAMTLRAQTPSPSQASRVVASNERLLFVFYTRTSMHRTLAQKMSSIRQVGTANFNQFLFMSNLTGVYSGSELFDVHDMEITTVPIPNGDVLPPISVQLPPLVLVGAYHDASIWGRDIAVGRVYGRIDRMKRMWPTPWNPSLERDNIPSEARLNEGREYYFVSSTASFASLSDAELASESRYMPGSTGILVTKPVAPTMGIQARKPASTQSWQSTFDAWRLQYEYPTAVGLDFVTMRNRARWLFGAGCYELLGNTLCGELHQWSTELYQQPLRGDYFLWTRYNSPCAVTPDSPTATPQHPLQLRY